MTSDLRIRMLAAVLVVAVPGIAFASPAATTGATCQSVSRAFLEALVQGKYAIARSHFSERVAAVVSDDQLEAVWARMQTTAGKYQGHGSPELGKSPSGFVAFTPLNLAKSARVLEVSCGAQGTIDSLYFLSPKQAKSVAAQLRLMDESVREHASSHEPVKAHVEADGVKVTPLAVPSPFGPLRGALTVPAGKGPFPAVVLVQGSGAHDFDETIGSNKPFRDIAEGLAKAGIASLRYDKRTFDYAQQSVAEKDFTVDDEVTDDALTALRLLAKRQQVDPHRVFLLGHSLGAQMAPRIAQRDGRLAGVIMLAAPARPLLEVSKQQIRELAPKQGASKQQIAASIKANEAEQALLDKADPKHPPHGGYGGAPQSYWLSLHNYHQVAVAKALHQPMLILQGGRDFQVSPELDFDAWKHALAGKRYVTFHLYPGLSHLFMPAPTKTLADYVKPAQVDPQVIAHVANWIKAQPAR